MEYALADFPASLAVMTGQQPVVVSVADGHADPSERALLEEGGYRTLLMLPLVSRGDSVGLLEIVDVADRVWNEPTWSSSARWPTWSAPPSTPPC